LSFSTPKNLHFHDLEDKVVEYFPDADIAYLEKAYEFAKEHHQDQKRASGAPYIEHPLAVAYLLADMKMDLASITTGLLHDTVEDTKASLEDVEKLFGKEVATLVDGVTKIGKINFRTKHEKQAENFRKMILAMAQDLRVILVKLADRTHNMRTLTHLNPLKQQRIAQETIDIFAPLANRLGISWMKTELEDLCLKYQKPEVYQKLGALISQKKQEREEYIDKLNEIISEKVKKYGLDVKIYGRAKNFFSIFKKMESREMDFQEIHDLVAFRVITKKISECYEVLGIVHSFFKPVPGRFKDYIAMPKNNMYQSLHTTVIGPFGESLEIQIRTQEMHDIAESGIAAHWEYKSGKLEEKDKNKFHWLRKLVESQETLKDPGEFMESVKLDLFMRDIYVFSPKGELIELPLGASPLDFAYTIHTDVGHHCTGSKVNGRIVPLKYKLRSGDRIEILTSPQQSPNKDWLKIVKTTRAKTKIRAHIRSEERHRARGIGHTLLDREFRKLGQSLAKMEKRKDKDEVAGKQSFATFEEMCISVGYGKIDVKKLVENIFPDEVKKLAEVESPLISDDPEKKRRKNKGKNRPLVRVQGLEDDVLVRFGKCCTPLPGDEIIGYISRGRGIGIHKIDCAQILDLDPNRAIDVEWDHKNPAFASLDVKIRILCIDETGLLNKMSLTITDSGVNIRSLNIKVNNDGRAIGLFDIEVRSKDQLLECINRLEAIKGIISVDRV